MYNTVFIILHELKLRLDTNACAFIIKSNVYIILYKTPNKQYYS